MKNPTIIGIAISALGCLAATGNASNHHHTERGYECKNAVMTETREFQGMPMAAFSLNGHHHSNLLWVIHWDGQTANGSCKYHDGKFQGVKIHTHLKYSHHQQKSEHYQGTYGGFYYDRHVGKWRDPDGKVCHTCTPENGFPRYGG